MPPNNIWSRRAALQQRRRHDSPALSQNSNSGSDASPCEESILPRETQKSAKKGIAILLRFSSSGGGLGGRKFHAEETLFFFEIGSYGMVIDDAAEAHPTPSRCSATKLKLPCGLINWQASRLLRRRLSVYRQGRAECHTQCVEQLHVVPSTQAVGVFICMGCCYSRSKRQEQLLKSIFSSDSGMHMRTAAAHDPGACALFLILVIVFDPSLFVVHNSLTHTAYGCTGCRAHSRRCCALS